MLENDPATADSWHSLIMRDEYSCMTSVLASARPLHFFLIKQRIWSAQSGERGYHWSRLTLALFLCVLAKTRGCVDADKLLGRQIRRLLTVGETEV